MRETTPLAPSTPDAAAATERLAAWVIGALTAIVIGGAALVISVLRGGHAGGSSWLPAINASLNGARRQSSSAPGTCSSDAAASAPTGRA